MGPVDFLLEFFADNVILFSFISGFLSEDVFLFFVVLTSVKDIGLLSFLLIGVLGFIGIALHDSILYYLTNHHLITKLSNKFKLSKISLMAFIDRFGGKNYLIPLIFSKFIYGIRTAGVVLVSRKEKKFRTFLFYNSIAIFIWLCVMLPLGWLTGRGFSFLFEAVRDIEKILAVAFIIVIVIYLISKIFKRKVKIDN